MRSRLLAVAALAALGVAGGAPGSAAAAQTFNVTNDQMIAYLIDGVSNPDLTLTRGQTYTFKINTVSHPFWIVQFLGAGDVVVNQYRPGVTNNGAESPDSVTFAVPASAPATLFYQCGFHDPMHGTLHIVDAGPTVPASRPIALAALAALLLAAGARAAARRPRRRPARPRA